MMRKLLYSFLFFLLLHTTGFGQRIWTGTTSSDWNTGSNWNTGVVPIGTVDVEIPTVTTNYPVVNLSASCKSITFSGNSGSLTVNSGATLTSGALTVNSSNTSPRSINILGTGVLSVSSVTVGLTSSTPTASITTVLTSNIANFNVSNNLTLNSRRNTQSNNASFLLESGILDLTGQIVTVNQNSTTSTFSMATGSQLGTLFLGYDGGVNPFNLSTTGTNTINFGGTGATVNYDRSNAQTVYITPYNNLTLSGSGVKTFGGTVSIAGNLSFGGTATATFNATANTAGSLTLNGNGQNSGTWGGTGTGASNIQTTYFNAPTTPANKFVTITNPSCTAGYWTGATSTDWNTLSNWCGNVFPTSTTDVVIPSGTPNQPTITSITGSVRNLTISSGATLTLANTGTTFLNISGDFTNNGTLTGNASSTVTLNGGVSVIQGSGTTTFGNLTINKGSASNTVTNSAKVFSVSGNLTVTNGNLILSATDASYMVSNNLSVASGSTLTHNVNWTTNMLLSVGGNIAIDGVYSTGGAPRTHVQMTGSGKTIHTGTSAFNILTFLSSGIITADGNLTVNDNFWAFYNATGGTFNIPSPYTVTAKQSLLNAGGSIVINGGALKVNGGFGIGYSLTNGSVTLSSGTLDADFVNIGDGTRTGTFSHTGGTANIGNLTVNSGANSYTCTNSPALNISGAWTNNGTFVRATSTVTFNGADQTVPNVGYYNLAFSGSGTKTLTASNAISNNLSIASGVISNLGTGLVHSAATLTLGGSAAASGSWGSTTSTATYQTNTFFSATTGIINVASTTCTVPTQQTFTGGGTTCNSTTGVAIGLAGSQNGFSYQLYRGTTALNTVTGTGGAISFGNFNVSGTYYVTATSTTYCSVRFTSFVNVTSYSAPVIPTATVIPVTCPTDSNGAITITSTASPAALTFIRANNQVVDLNTQLLSGRRTFTVEGWIKFNKNDYFTRMAIFGQNDAIEIAFEDDNLRCWTPSGGSVNLPLTSYPADNNWHHIAVTGDGTANGLKIYLDAAATVPVAVGGTSTSSYGSSTYSTKIGYAVMDDGGIGLTGQIFKVGFWDRALTAAEVTALAGGFVEYNASQNGLLAGFNFSEGTGNTIASVGSNTVTGTFGTAATAKPTWTDISTYSWASTPAGFTSSSKSLTGLTSRTYDLTVSLKNCSRTTSFTVGSTNTAPSITTQPSASTICSGSNTAFSVAANGTGLSYKWQVSTNSGSTFSDVSNGGVYSGATAATLNITGATAGLNNNRYQVIVSGTCTPAATSNAVALTVNTPPSITTQPVVSTICSGANTAFSVAATGTGLSYQWQVSTNGGTNYNDLSDDAVYSGVTAATLNITGAASTMNNNRYRVVINGTCTPATVTSSAVALTVNTAPSITTQPSASTICSGSNTSFSVVATGTATLSYKWQVSTNGGSTFSDVSNGGIYSGAATATLSITNATTGLNNNQYQVIVSGACSPTVTSTPVALTVNTPPSITTQPAASTICSGANTAFSVAATGTGLSYKWQVSTNSGATFSDVSNGGVYSGATTTTLSITAATAALNNNRYQVIVSGTCTPATVTSSAVALTVNTAPSITTQPSASTICSGANTTFSVAATGTVLSYKWQVSTNGGGTFSDVSNGAIYSGATAATLSITGATTGLNNNQYQVIISGTCTPTVTSAPVALTVNAPPSITTQPAASTICSGANTAFSVAATGTGLSYKWQVSTNSGATFSDVSNGGVYSGATTTTLSITGATAALNNNRYQVIVSGTCTPATVTSSAVALTVNTAPSITTQPSASTICSGANTTFSVAATGTVLSYKWQVSTNGGGTFSDVSNGGVYSGATTATLSITGAATGLNNNQYHVIISGTCAPAVTSTAVILTVKSIENTPSKGTVTDVTCLGQGKVILENMPLGNFEINQTGTASRSISGSSSTGTYEVTGLAQGTYQFTVQTLTTCESAQLVNVVINDESSTVWTATGWSNGPPTISKSVTISSTVGNPFATDMIACSLTINVPNGEFDPIITVPENVTVRITNAVISNSKLVFESGSSLIQTANIQNTGEIVYKRKAKVSRYDLTYWSMPVTADNSFTMKKFSPNTLADKYFTFDANTTKWVENLNGTLPMVTGKGYSIRAPQSHDANTKTDFTGVFTGIPNNGNIDIPVDNGKWYFVGNPYPSAVNADTFLLNNTGVGTLYFWAHVSLPVLAADGYYYYTDDFIVYNSLGSTDVSVPNYFKGYIAAAQGFFLKSPATTTIKFNNGQRDSNNSQFYKTAQSNIEKNRIWLNFKNTTGVFKQILVGYATGATNTTDADFDALSMGSNSLIDFYSINNSKKLSIQGRALPFVKSDVVTLGFMLANKGDYTISIDHADGLFNNGQDIYLEDKTTGKTTNLRLADYTFTTAAGTFNSRFVIRYTDKTLGVEDVESVENSVLVSVKNKVITIISSKESIKEINIFDIGAQLMYNKNNVNSSEFQISNLHSSDQALLVKITLENGYTLTKKIIYSNL